ncbi:MAG: Secretion system C-terminal sorting domain [Bacteroidota bacterium]|jgi:hypothetical protein
MKKSLPLLVFFSFLTFVSFGQSCIPGANFVDSTFGVWPDTVQNLPPAVVNVFYSTDINFKAPADAGDVPGSPASGAIESFTVSSVAGLPPGINYSCNSANCTYVGGNNGCANVYGTPTQTGVFNITISIDAQVNIGFGVILPYSQDFVGYKIVVGNAGLITGVIEPLHVFPNPSNGIATVEGLNGSRLTLCNLNGQELLSQSIEGITTTEINMTELNPGVYFVNVYGDQGVETVKIMKD